MSEYLTKRAGKARGKMRWNIRTQEERELLDAKAQDLGGMFFNDLPVVGQVSILGEIEDYDLEYPPRGAHTSRVLAVIDEDGYLDLSPLIDSMRTPESEG